ncbi:hypothetical protein CLF_105810 [Clonorchis sinensis]|uniref:Uncharacterized protein n=1 Tax=Clonorchis sinensis TaxID=79923 RepID=G7YE88_CLOSI|nr:hypothetical protein CLF_105810 [Clonorchis sinensis]
MNLYHPRIGNILLNPSDECQDQFLLNFDQHYLRPHGDQSAFQSNFNLEHHSQRFANCHTWRKNRKALDKRKVPNYFVDGCEIYEIRLILPSSQSKWRCLASSHPGEVAKIPKAFVVILSSLTELDTICYVCRFANLLYLTPDLLQCRMPKKETHRREHNSYIPNRRVREYNGLKPAIGGTLSNFVQC